MYPTIQLRHGKAESLKRFHPWIFSGAIQRMPDNLTEGQIVRVIDHKGEFLAIGVLSFVERKIDNEFWKERLSEAFNMRCSIGLVEREDNNTLRLVHGEGDQLPGVIIDLYGKTAVMQAHSVGMHLYRKEIAAALIDVCKGIIENVYYKSETTLPFKADRHEKDGFIIGGNEDNIAIEYGLKFISIGYEDKKRASS